MVTDTFALYTEQVLSHEFLQAFLVLGCVFLGWCASGVMIRLLSGSSDKAGMGSATFRNEVAIFTANNSVEEAAVHWGLDKKQVLDCQNMALCSRWIETVASWLWGSSKSIDHKEPDQQKETYEAQEISSVDEFGIAQTCIDTKCSSNPGLALLEHYGVFGAAHGSWAGPLH